MLNTEHNLPDLLGGQYLVIIFPTYVMSHKRLYTESTSLAQSTITISL